MVKQVIVEGIGVDAVTLKVNQSTKEYLEANFKDAATGKVDVNGKNLAVKLTGDNEVGFGSGAASDALFGIILTYEQDGFAAVQYRGFAAEVETTAAVAVGVKTLAVNNAGKVVSVDSAEGRGLVTKAATSSDKYVDILLG